MLSSKSKTRISPISGRTVKVQIKYKTVGHKAAHHALEAAKEIQVPWDLEEVNKEFAERSLREFVTQAWHVVEPMTQFAPGWHIDATCEHLQAVTEGQIQNLLINMPPRHMKSLLLSVLWPAWEWIKKPHTRWLFSSHAQKLATRDSVKCRRLILSRWYQQRWFDRYTFTSDQNEKIRFENDKSGYRMVASVGGSSQGEGGDRICCDDPNDVMEATSELSRQAVIDWWDELMSMRVNDAKTSSRVVVMQRVHEQDLSGHLLSTGLYTHLMLPAEYERKRKCTTSLGWSDPRTVEGELLWPEKFGHKELADIKITLGSYGTAGQLQQRPAPLEGGIIKKVWWRYYTQYPEPEELDAILFSWDMAFKDLKTSSFVVGQAWGMRGGEYLLLDQIRRKASFSQSIEGVKHLRHRIFERYKWTKATLTLIEDKANGPAVIDALKREVTGLVAVGVDGSKLARLMAVQPVIESGNVLLPHVELAPWVEDYVEELATFPNAENDDQVDATSQALRRLEKMRSKGKLAPVVSVGKVSHWGATATAVPSWSPESRGMATPGTRIAPPVLVGR